MAKKSNFSKLEKQILDDIKDKCDNVIKETVREITFQLELAYESAIDAFYNHAAFKKYGSSMRTNVPNSYERTYSLYYASSNAGGFRFVPNTFKSAENYQKKLKQQSALDKRVAAGVGVRNGQYYAGITVNPSFYPYSPYKQSTSFVFERAFEQGVHGFSKRVYNKNERDEYQDDLYTMGNQYHGNISAPIIMNPTPKELMDTAYWHIGSRRNINETLTTCMNKIF